MTHHRPRFAIPPRFARVLTAFLVAGALIHPKLDALAGETGIDDSRLDVTTEGAMHRRVRRPVRRCRQRRA